MDKFKTVLGQIQVKFQRVKNCTKKKRNAISYLELYFRIVKINAKPRTDMKQDKMIFTHIIFLFFSYRVLDQRIFSLI